MCWIIYFLPTKSKSNIVELSICFQLNFILVQIIGLVEVTLRYLLTDPCPSSNSLIVMKKKTVCKMGQTGHPKFIRLILFIISDRDHIQYNYPPLELRQVALSIQRRGILVYWNLSSRQFEDNPLNPHLHNTLSRYTDIHHRSLTQHNAEYCLV